MPEFYEPSVPVSYTHLDVYKRQGVYRPAIEEWTEFTNILGQEMDNIIQGTKSMDEGLAYAQSELEKLMAE